MKRLFACLTAISLTAALIPCAFAESENTPSEKETEAVIFRFDFGAKPEEEFTSVSAKDKYTKEKGYGFADTSGVKNVDASGQGALADAVEFTRFGIDSDNTFNVDLPSGNYKIKVTAGDIERMSIACEGYFAIMNMTGNNCEAEVVLPVTDGQLNILATEGKVDTPFFSPLNAVASSL